MIRKSRFLLPSIRVLQKHHHTCNRYYSSSEPDNNGKKEHVSRLTRFADTLSRNVFDEDETTKEGANKDVECQTNSAKLPEFNFEIPRKKPTAQDIGNATNAIIAAGHRKKSSKWTKEEEELLLDIVEKSRITAQAQVNWKEVAKHFEHRSLLSCRHRYTMLTRIKRGIEDFQSNMAGNSPPWSFLKANEMEAINEGVWMYGDRSWRKVAEHVKKTTGATRSISILTRAWFLGLCPKTRKAPLWDKEKTEKLKNLIKIHGKDPVFLSLKFFPEYPPKFLSYIISSLGSKQENRDPRTRHIGNYGTPNISRRE